MKSSDGPGALKSAGSYVMSPKINMVIGNKAIHHRVNIYIYRTFIYLCVIYTGHKLNIFLLFVDWDG